MDAKYTMPSYKLTYFEARGRAETLRMCMVFGGIEFEDVRIKMEEWPAVKPTTPFGGLPMMAVDGKTYFESKALARLMAKKVGIAGKDDYEACMADAIVYYITDIQDKFYEVVFMPPEMTESATAGFVKKMDEVMPCLEKLLGQNKGGDGYFVGDNLTWADLHFYQFAENILGHTSTALDKYPDMKALFKRVGALPKIAAYLKVRPVADH